MRGLIIGVWVWCTRYVEEASTNKTNTRVYALKFTSTPKKVHFFWMQEPASQIDKDKELAEKVNAMINGETPVASAGGVGQMDQAQLMVCALVFCSLL